MYDPRFNVVLYQPEIPQNTGNIGRTCVAAAAKLWLVRPLGFRLDDHYLQRSGMDYWQDLQWESLSGWDAVTACGDPGEFWYVTKFGQRDLWDVPLDRGATFVFGAESQGLPSSLRERHAERTLRIPMVSGVRSLNLSNAVAIVLYEAWRQLESA